LAGKAWLVTHTETQFDKEGRVHGHLDPPLSDGGERHADRIAKSFKGKSVSRIHTSPRKRAVALANKIGKVTGAKVQVDGDLEPWRLGSLSGAKTNSVRPVLDFFSRRPSRAIPGGEAKADVLKRYQRFHKKIKHGDVVVGHSQHSLALQHVQKGGDASKVPMFGGKAGEVKEINL